MRSVETWNKKLDKLVEKGREIEKLTILYDLDPTTNLFSSALLATLKQELEIAVENITYERVEGAVSYCARDRRGPGAMMGRLEENQCLVHL